MWECKAREEEGGLRDVREGTGGMRVLFPDLDALIGCTQLVVVYADCCILILGQQWPQPGDLREGLGLAAQQFLFAAYQALLKIA